jgi:hypothetical protein
MPFCPTTPGTLLTESLDKISPNEPITRLRFVFACFQLHDANTKLMSVLTGIGAVLVSYARQLLSAI